MFLSYIHPIEHGTSCTGLWRVDLYRVNGNAFQASDTFTVQESAIPELPTLLSALFMLVCTGVIYMKLRGKYVSTNR